ncbi:Translation initiation factor 2 [Thermodesulfovibrio sp. N1]|uniref:translation initiation factor IF-2 n=1 Tax=unclassified Thermodesulfovibrio TaxID=2645936 RepID=UPI00083A538C|nr:MULTISPECIES: translation initiation factor IF-2 [unclassified Thermodesulfovibrio]MDI1471007.1 translation initiation factor IF-2 [Thermodesulfovibrio sp. 1176]ODA43453.1 Translation initiation factor 2 [Thermodesulfovibrio sp. N1]
MSDKGIRSIELAKELGVKTSDIVKYVEKIRNTQFKKGTTNIKIEPEEIEKIREHFKGQEENIKESPKIEKEEEIKEQKVVETKIEEKKEEIKESPKIEKPKISQKIQLIEEELKVEEEEITLPGRFRREISFEKIEKIKPKPVLTKVPPKKIEPKKWLDLKEQKKQKDKNKREEQVTAPITAPRKKSIKIQEGTTVKEFAELIGQKVADVIKKFMELGYMPTINQPVDPDAAILVAESFGIKVELAQAQEIDVIEEEIEDAPENLLPRPPIVTVMGHVDHGKTSLLDAIRKTKVIEQEAGGITQHIGAYKVTLQGKDITFLDTPGHEAFTALRARGAKVTDIVVLVVAADDGVMPQTVEAINHAKAAGVPIIVAVNKIDKPEANPQRVRTQLSEYGIIPEEWGGQNIFVDISAKKRIGIENLLEMILLQAEIMELKANPNKPARGTIIESRLDKGRGPVATVIIQNGTLKVGDAFVAGTTYGKVRALNDDTGKRITEASPSTPVEVVGFEEVPQAGDSFIVVEDEKIARQIANLRAQKKRLAEMQRAQKITLQDLYEKIKEGEVKELNLIIKGDVQGSIEALKKAVEDIVHPEVKVKVIHAAVGGITESDVNLAATANAIIIGFNVRPEPKAQELAEHLGVDIKLYSIIYEVIDDVKKALIGMLQPEIKEKILGRAEVRAVFKISKIGTVAGCYVLNGVISRASDGIRVIRDNIVVYEGKIGSLKRFKEDVREVQAGYECGIAIENFNDIKEGDILENYILEKIQVKGF